MAGATSPQDRAAAKAARAERREKAVRLSCAGHTYVQIAKELGYSSPQHAHRDVKAALQEALKRQDLAVDELREKHTRILNEALRVADRVMNQQHVAHSGGRLVQREITGPDGSMMLIDVIDDGPNLAAVDRVRQVSESIRKLWGTDVPAKVEQTIEGTIGYVINVDPGEMEQL